MHKNIPSQIVFLTVLVGFLAIGNISIGRGANYITQTDLTLNPVAVFLGETVMCVAHVWSPQVMLIPQGDVLFEDSTNGAFQTTVPLNGTGFVTFNWTIPLSYPQGTITIHARYAGNDWFDPSEDTSDLYVDNGLYTTTTLLILSSDTLFPEETLVMTAGIQSSETSMIPQGDVLFEEITNRTFQENVPLNSTGFATYSWVVPTTYPPSTILIRAFYGGSANFSTSEDYKQLNIESPYFTVMALTLTPDPVAIGESVDIVTSVWSPETIIIPSGTVKFYLYEENLLLDEKSLNGTGYATTDWIVPVSCASYMDSTVTIRAEYSGATYFAASTTNSSLAIEKTTYTTEIDLTLAPNAVRPGSPVTLSAQVATTQTYLIPTGSVSFTDTTNAKSLGTVSLDITGLGQLQWTVPSNQPPSNLNIRANYLGDPDGLFTPSEDTNSILVEQYSSSTTLTISPMEMWDDATSTSINIRIHVSGIGTSRTPSGLVTIRDRTNNFVIDSLTLDVTGSASKTWTVPSSYTAGVLDLTAAYEGNNWFYPSSGSGYFTIKHDGTPPKIRLTIQDDEVVRGSINIEISAEDERSVTLFVNDERMIGNPIMYAIDTENFPDGEFLLNVRAVDKANNEAVLNRKIIIDNTPPTVFLEYKENTQTMIVMVLDQHLNSTIVYINQSLLKDWMHPQNNSETEERYSVEFTNLLPGTYHVRVDSIDVIGNLAFETLIIELKETPISEPSEQSSEIIPPIIPFEVLDGEYWKINITTSQPIELTVDISEEPPEGVTLPENVGSLNRYLTIEISNETSQHNITMEAKLWVRYTDEEVATANLYEETLALYYWIPEAAVWKLIDNPSVNTTENYVFGSTSHFSLWAIIGDPIPSRVSKNSIPFSVIGLGAIGLAFIAIKQIAGQRGASLTQFTRRIVNGRRRE
ncbi:MAG: Ig-like domain-containing protein [Candidatus Heimdallarchaeota archaeon]